MKRFLVIAAIVLGVLGLSVGLIWLRLRADRPEALIARLASARGADRQELVLRLGLARGDVTAKLIDAFGAATAPAFRAELVDLIFRRNLREPDERLLALARKALTDGAPEVRRTAAYGLVVYGDAKSQRLLADRVADPDPQIRRQVYSLFAACSWQPEWRDAYKELSDKEREALVAACAARMKTEPDPETAFLARAVVGLEVSIRCENAMQALAAGDLPKAKSLMEGALALDPENKQAQARFARLHLSAGDPGAAVATARKYGALIEIPRLSKPPVIDGDPTDDVWREAYTADAFYLSTSSHVAKPASGKSRCHIGYRDGRIYIAMLGFEEDTDKLIITKKNRDDEVFRDDCVELLFNPENSEKDFVQFIINPLGTLQDIKNHDAKANFKCEAKAGVFKERGYWAAEFAIDVSELSPKPITAQTIWSFNAYRTRIGAASEQDGIWPTYGSSLRSGLYPLAVFKDAPAP